MSTRCNIIIKDGAERIYLYHHHDGYPMGVGTELQDYRIQWAKVFTRKHLVNIPTYEERDAWLKDYEAREKARREALAKVGAR